MESLDVLFYALFVKSTHTTLSRNSMINISLSQLYFALQTSNKKQNS